MSLESHRPSWLGQSSPRGGSPLVPKVERLAKPLRDVAARLEAELQITPEQFSEVWGPRAPGLGYCAPPGMRETQTRAAWCLIGEWLTARVLGAAEESTSLREAHEWFLTGTGDLPVLDVPDWSVPGLSSDAETIHALLPYLLDPGAPATRRDVLKGSAETLERVKRKAGGVYFTPGDVAHFMASGISGRTAPGGRWLDPAAGSGVFLRAVLSVDPTASVYGLDVEPIAAEMTAFVLAAEGAAVTTPWALWHQHRLNFATGDALLLSGIGGASPTGVSARTALKKALDTAETLTGVAHEGFLGASDVWHLESAFPELSVGADVVVQNPPYSAPSPSRKALIQDRWGSAPANIYPLFVRLGLDLLGPQGHMTAVVPSSLVCSGASAIVEARRSLARAGGDLEILNFDRAPDGLFGDDIKTRTSVLFLHTSNEPRLRVGGMIRLTSKNRESLLRRGESTSLPPSALTMPMVPKVDSADHLPLFRALQAAPVSLEAMIRHVGKGALQDQPVGESRSVLLAPTAYNWLNVQRSAGPAQMSGHDSASPYWRLDAESGSQADALYAVLSSRVAFWTWRTFGDGFHVGRWLLRLTPGVDDPDTTDLLAKLGGELWHRASQVPVVSLNAGRRSVAFPGSSHPELLDEIDAFLMDSLGLSVGHASLRLWARDLAAAGRTTIEEATVESVTR